MEDNNTKSLVLSSLFWKLMERGGTQGIAFVIQIVLARLLLPEDYGILSLITIFINLANVFVQSGFNTALIQQKDVDEVDYSSVFYLSLLIASVLYIILYMFAPTIAYFYQINELALVIRVLALTLFFGAFNSIQNAIIARNMQFKKLFTSSLISSIISGLIGVYMAYSGFGVWSLVFQQLCYQMLVSVVLYFTVKWRPLFIFSLKRTKILFSYGWKLLVSSLMDTLYINIRSLVIGKIYSPSALGYYSRGEQFPSLIVTNINGSIQSVMLPALASQQDDKKRVKNMMRRAIVTSSYLIFPMMMGLAVIAEPLVLILLTEKWLPAVPFIQIACLSYSLWPIQTTNLQAINALGRSDIFLKLEIVKKIVGMLILVVSVKYGIYAIALGGIVSGIISMFINTFPSKSLLGYGLKEQVKDVLPALLISLVVGISIYSIKFLGLYYLVTMCIQIILGILLYIGLSYVFKLESMIYLFNTMKEVLDKRK